MRIVVKVGTSTLTHTSGRINIRRTEKLCKILSDVKNAGHELILVSSGAIGMGVGKEMGQPLLWLVSFKF
jgi:glutamate 5-kinase